ncbi:MAG: hypothetical protein ACLFQB_06480 [Chitinispirillaceae bacterium]
MLDANDIRELEQTYDIRVLKARIIGRRWSNEGGGGGIPISPPHRIQVGENNGFIIYGWDQLGTEQKEHVQKELEKNYVHN